MNKDLFLFLSLKRLHSCLQLLKGHQQLIEQPPLVEHLKILHLKPTEVELGRPPPPVQVGLSLSDMTSIRIRIRIRIKRGGEVSPPPFYGYILPGIAGRDCASRGNGSAWTRIGVWGMGDVMIGGSFSSSTSASSSAMSSSSVRLLSSSRSGWMG